MDGLGGADVLRSGFGFDSVNARDGIADDVDCGPDDDAATTDAVDTRVNCDPAPVPSQRLRRRGVHDDNTTTTTTVTVFGPARLVFDLGYVYSAAPYHTERGLARGRVGARTKATCRTPKGKRCEHATSRRLRPARRSGCAGSSASRCRWARSSDPRNQAQHGRRGQTTIRKRKAPSVKTLCLPPGATRPAAY